MFMERKSVRKGAILLDQKCPGWFHRIDLDTLDISSQGFDVLTQVYGSYGKGIDALGIRLQDGYKNGFSLNYADVLHGLDHETKPLLQQAWKDAILDRREGKDPPRPLEEGSLLKFLILRILYKV